MRKNAVLFLISLFVSAGLFFGVSSTVFAEEASVPHNGHACVRDGVKDCEWAFSSVGNYQAWGSDWYFKYKHYGGQDSGSAKQDICVSRDSTMWNSDDICWTTKNVSWSSLPGGYYTASGINNISNGEFGDYGYVVLHVRVDHADTSSNFTVEERRVSADSLTRSPTSLVKGQSFTLSWATDWAVLDAYIQQTQGGGGFFDDVVDGNSQKSKSGTTASIVPTTSGTKTFKLCASGPGIEPGSPDGGPGGGDSGPPWEAYLPYGIALAAAGDGMTTNPCKELSFTIDRGASLKTTPVADNDNGTAEYTFNAIQGGSNPANQTLTIRNNTLSADRDLSWKAQISYVSGSGWLSLQNTQGNVAAGNTVDKNVNVDVSGLSAGTYKAKITITGCSNGTDSTGGGCNANTISNGQYAQADNYNPLILNVTFVVGNSGTVKVTSNVNNTDFGFGGTGAFGGCPAMLVNAGQTWTCNTVDPGTHTINPENKISEGYDDPPVVKNAAGQSGKETQTLSAGGTIEYNISYSAATGTISVTSNKNTNWNIDGPGSNDFSATNDNTQNYNNVPLGSYTISGVPAVIIADSGKWFSLNDISPDTTQTLSSSGQTKTFTIDYQQSQPICSPAAQSVQAGNPASFTATGGDGTFSWAVSPGGSPSSGKGSSFSTTYSATGSKTITVTSNQGQTDTCALTVTASPTPTPSPTLSVNLTANPSTGSAPLSSVLTATVGGTAAGTINYNFWWNCSNTSNSVAAVESVCGALPAPGAGSCASNAAGYKCNGVNTNPQSAPAYSYNSSSTGKVIVERDIAAPAEARTSITISSPPPSASGVTVTPPNYCVSGPAATVSWTYSDPMGSPQSAYQVQIDNNASFVSPEVNSGKVLSGSTAYFSGTGILQFNINYNVRVMVWNSSDTPSSWSSTVGFSTPQYAYPQVDFTFSPTNPPISEPVQFTDATTFYAPGPTTWSWLFGDAGSSVLQNPTHTYATEGSYGATLTTTDNAGQACSLTKTVNIQKAIPIWKEVAPR